MRFAILLMAAAGMAAPVMAQTNGALTPFEAVRGTPTTAGAWTLRSLPTGTEANFAGRFALRCDRATARVIMQRLDLPAGTSGPMVVSTDGMTRGFVGTTVALSARDPLFDAIAFSRGRFVVTGTGVSPLIIPAWPEAARSIEDCRN
jgi:hypothetical protein